MPAANQAFVFLATTDCYCMGALVVGQCLRRHRTTRQTVVMVSTNVSSQARAALGHVFDQVLVVDVLDSGDQAHLSWLGQPELGVTFTKLHCWTLTQYSKCVFLDADTLITTQRDESPVLLSPYSSPLYTPLPMCLRWFSTVHTVTPLSQSQGREEEKTKGQRRREAKGERRSQRGEEKPKVREATVSLIENLTESLLREVTLLTEKREKRPDYPQSQEKWGGAGDPRGPSEEESEVTDTAFNPMEDPATEPTAAETEEDDLEQCWLWEEGQADYLGKDAFDNIQQKLDRFLD